IDHNRIIHPIRSGILLGAGVDTGQVSDNHISGGPAGGNGILLRAEVIHSGGLAPAAHLDVKSNKVTGVTMDGIRLSQGANSNTVETNKMVSNGRNGMMLTNTEGPQPVNNQINNNTMRSNAMD